jgi:hypothetical protein
MKDIKKQLLRFGKWNYGDRELVVDEKLANQLVKNFKEHTPFAPVIRGHHPQNIVEKNPDLVVSKNIKDIEVDDEGVNVVFEAEEKELEKYNDVSASFTTNYENHETGENIGAVLEHVALVVNPYIKGLKDFKLLSEIEDDHYIIYLSEIMAEKDIKKIELEEEADTPEEEDSAEEAEEETPEAPEEEAPEEEAESEDSVDMSEVSSDDLVKLQETVLKQSIELAEIKADKQVQTYLSDGKILPKQKDAVRGLLMAEAQTVNLSDGTRPTVGKLFSDFLDAMPSLVNLSETKQEDPEDLELPAEFIADLRKVRGDMEDVEFQEYLDTNAKALRESYQKNIS